MTKKCLGCGIKLQSNNSLEAGYAPSEKNNLCMRCFKLKNYNELINTGVNIDNQKLIEKINKRKEFVIFLVDFLNIYQEVIDLYKSIKIPKVMAITKSDIIPNNIKKDILVKNIKDIYNIKEDIYLVSSVGKKNLNILYNLLDEEKRILLAGVTNTGKSSIINALTDSDITVSSKSNTTQDFIKIKYLDKEIIDAPGFINDALNEVVKKEIKPITYQLKPIYYLKFDDFDLMVKTDVNVTIYMNKKIEKRRLKKDVSYDIVVLKNHDLVIKGLGFIKFSVSTRINISIDKKYIEVRPSLVGGKNE
jgi:hypothetical protein